MAKKYGNPYRTKQVKLKKRYEKILIKQYLFRTKEIFFYIMPQVSISYHLYVKYL
jgi:hypothetical protein